jgi:hypothetical protein
VQKLLQSFEWNDEPASNAALESVQAELGKLPPEYLAVVRVHNGGEGFIGQGSYLRLWPVEELPENNRTLAPERPTNAILIGSDGSDKLFAVEATARGYGYFAYPQIELTSHGKTLADSWDGFLQALSRM